MESFGIKARVILLGTLPGVFFALILAGYAISTAFDNLNYSLYERGRIIATQLAPAAEYGVISGNGQRLQKLVQQVLTNEQELRSVVITDKVGKILAFSGRPIAKKLRKQMIAKNSQELVFKRGIIFLSPIERSLEEIEDFPSDSLEAVALREQSQDLVVGHVYVELSNLALQSLKQDLFIKMLLIGLFGLFCSLMIAWFIGRSITKPIQEIAFAVDKIGEGVFSHTIKESSSGELKVLQKGFNLMSHSLKNAYENLQEKIHDATALLRHQAQHDDLTGLINRREFEVRLEESLENSVENGTQHIFCYLDLDQFKLVNDTCGHSAGDELLRQISALFANKLEDKDTLARIGGDEFGLLLIGSSLANANIVIDKLLKLARDYRFVHEEKVFNIGVSIGVVVVDSNFNGTSDIMHAADAACYSAKTAGRNQSFLYNHGDMENLQRHKAVDAISDITDEIDDDNFILYCQPIVQLSDAALQPLHYEVLIRKVGDKGEITLPTSFIPSAERYHLMPNIDRWVIKNTFAAYRKLLDSSLEKCNYIFSINLSGTSLGDKSFLGYIREQFAIYAIPPEAICFEITETAAIVNLKHTINLLTALKKLGCKFALDDFGSGMSSFMYLKNFDVDYLKIDGSFVKEMHINKIDHAMVRSIHSVAEALDIQTVAEFVENDEILKELKKIGVHYGQGIGLGKPVVLKHLIENFSKVEL
ncbi:MAG: EAL domain-containing protein [Methylophilaceae bacterium]